MTLGIGRNPRLLLLIISRIYDIDNDGFISSEELATVLKMMVGNNLNETQIQQIVDKTFLAVDKVKRTQNDCLNFPLFVVTSEVDSLKK